jgi:hypothetical protein
MVQVETQFRWLADATHIDACAKSNHDFGALPEF